MSLFEKVNKKNVDIFFTDGLNLRLATKDLNIAEITAIAASKDMTIEDVMAMAEQDGWEYSGEQPRDGLSYVCSAFVAALWKAGGLFE